jgi:hypothetical protein
MTDEKTYSVGHKRPPQHTRFKAGQSGNPKGKAIGTLNLKNDLEQEFSERIPIREGDRSFRISKLRALLKATMAKGVNGDIRAANILFQLFLKTILRTKSLRAPRTRSPTTISAFSMITSPGGWPAKNQST